MDSYTARMLEEIKRVGIDVVFPQLMKPYQTAIYALASRASSLNPRRYNFKKFSLGFTVSPELVADDRYYTEALRRIRMRNYPLHLQPLDKGDLKFMKQMGWEELEYRAWLFEEVEGYSLSLKSGLPNQPATEQDLAQANGHGGLAGNIRGKHYDSIVVDDLVDAQVGYSPADMERFLNRNASSLPQVSKIPQGPLPGLPNAPTPIQARRNMISLSRENLVRKYVDMTSLREAVTHSPPTAENYQTLLMELHERTIEYLDAAQAYLVQSSINLGLPELSSQAGAQGRG